MGATEKPQLEEQTNAPANTNTQNPSDHAAGYGGIGLMSDTGADVDLYWAYVLNSPFSSVQSLSHV